MRSPITLGSIGPSLCPQTVKPGMPITLIGRVVKSGDPYMNLTERSQITLTDSGKEIYRTANFGQPAPAAQ